jgi:hypothetical protein
VRRHGHWSVVGHPLPSVKGQHTQTHLPPLPTTTVVESMPPLTVPGSPLPVSPAVSCHGAGPSSKLEEAGAAPRFTVPAVTQAVIMASVEAVPPLTVTEHQLR